MQIKVRKQTKPALHFAYYPPIVPNTISFWEAKTLHVLPKWFLLYPFQLAHWILDGAKVLEI